MTMRDNWLQIAAGLYRDAWKLLIIAYENKLIVYQSDIKLTIELIFFIKHKGLRCTSGIC